MLLTCGWTEPQWFQKHCIQAVHCAIWSSRQFYTAHTIHWWCEYRVYKVNSYWHDVKTRLYHKVIIQHCTTARSVPSYKLHTVLTRLEIFETGAMESRKAKVFWNSIASKMIKTCVMFKPILDYTFATMEQRAFIMYTEYGVLLNLMADFSLILSTAVACCRIPLKQIWKRSAWYWNWR